MKTEKVRYYNSYIQDFTKSRNQNCKIPENYNYITKSFFKKAVNFVIYLLVLAVGTVYCKLVLHLKFKGRKNLKNQKEGFFVYGNHTQPVGDAFIPAMLLFPKHMLTLVSPANFGVVFIGKLLKFLGALPVGSTVSKVKKLNQAVENGINNKKPVVIYPEAHVWEYYTKIRPFSASAFKFPAKLNKPVFCFTVTYRKSKIFKKPLTEVLVNGPFFAKGETIKQKAEYLQKTVFNTMQKNSLNSNIEYIKYVKKI